MFPFVVRLDFRPMKRWLPWLALPLLMAVWLVSNPARGQAMLQDTDTKVLLAAIRERNDPLSWFGGDWPLQNHFYRPVSTITFEFDNALYGDNAEGYGRTNAILAALCILATFWLWREVTNDRLKTTLATLWFAGFHFWGNVQGLVSGLCWLLAGLSLIGLARGGLKDKVWPVAAAGLGLVFLSEIFAVSTDFSYRVVAWLPGRTASVMTVFALVSLASYARYLRLTTTPAPAPATAIDVPATKGTVVEKPAKFSGMCLAVSFVAAALALGSYEQAVMLPAIVTALFVLAKTQRRKPNIGPVVGFWVLLGAYLVLRSRLVPSDVSGYQAQQFRSGPGVYLAIADFGFPIFKSAITLANNLSTDLLTLLTGSTWAALFSTLATVSTHVATWKSSDRWPLLATMSMGLLTFLPMAWLKYFGHYLYWPAAMWSMYVVLVAGLVGKLFLTAVSPPAIQAPARPHPAPGSLPHP